jgi:hypothetical protein
MRPWRPIYSSMTFDLEAVTLPKYGFNPEDGVDTFLRNVGNHLQDYTVSQLIKQHSTVWLFLSVMLDLICLMC